MLSINKSQSIYIDFIRGVSAQLVLIGHLYGFYFNNQNIFIQNFGVVIFFILSGHLVTLSALRLLKDKYFNFKFFFIDRFSRIYAGLIPALIICLLIDVFNVLISGPDQILLNINNLNLQSFLASLFNLGGLPDPINIGSIIQPLGSMRPLWSVALEWWIYIFFGISLFLIRRKKHLGLGMISLSIIIIYMQFYLNMSHIAFFVVTAWILSSGLVLINTKIFNNYLILFLSFILLLFGFNKYAEIHFYEPIIMLSLIGIYFSCFEIFKDINYSKKFIFLSKKISSFSYSLYLIHYTLIVILKPLLNIQSIVEMIMIYFICNIFAYYFYKTFEVKYYSIRNFLKGK